MIKSRNKGEKREQGKRELQATHQLSMPHHKYRRMVQVYCNATLLFSVLHISPETSSQAEGTSHLQS